MRGEDSTISAFRGVEGLEGRAGKRLDDDGHVTNFILWGNMGRFLYSVMKGGKVQLLSDSWVGMPTCLTLYATLPIYLCHVTNQQTTLMKYILFYYILLFIDMFLSFLRPSSGRHT